MRAVVVSQARNRTSHLKSDIDPENGGCSRYSYPGIHAVPFGTSYTRKQHDDTIKNPAADATSPPNLQNMGLHPKCAPPSLSQ